MGPVEYLIIEFPGNQFNGDIAPALAELVDDGTIHIIDLLFVKKDAEGNVLVVELEGLDEAAAAAFDELEGDIYDLFNEEDVMLTAELLAPSSSAAIIVYEQLWAVRLRDAISDADGRLVEYGRVLPEAIDAALEALPDIEIE